MRAVCLRLHVRCVFVSVILYVTRAVSCVEREDTCVPVLGALGVSLSVRRLRDVLV